MDRRRVLPIFLVVFTNILGAGVILPVLPLLVQDTFGASATVATGLQSTYFLAQFIAAPILGRYSDRIGRRPVLIVSQFGTVLSFIWFIAAIIYRENFDAMLPAGGLIMLFAARALDGLTGGNITAAQAYMTDISTPATRAQALGVLGAAFGTGFIFGPAFGGLLARFGLTAPFIGAAIITAITVLLSIFLLKESLPPENRAGSGADRRQRIPLRSLLSQRPLFIIFLISLVATLAFAALQSTFALFSEAVLFPGLTTEEVSVRVGFILAYIGVVSVINQATLIRPLVARFGERRLVIIGQFSLMIGFLAFILISQSVIFTLMMTFIAFGNGLSQTNLQALVTRFGTEKTQGEILGHFQSVNNIAQIAGPILAGIAFDLISPQAPFALSMPLLVVTTLLGLLLLRMDIPGESRQEQRS